MSAPIYDADRVPSEYALAVARSLPEEEAAAFKCELDKIRAARETAAAEAAKVTKATKSVGCPMHTVKSIKMDKFPPEETQHVQRQGQEGRDAHVRHRNAVG